MRAVDGRHVYVSLAGDAATATPLGAVPLERAVECVVRLFETLAATSPQSRMREAIQGAGLNTFKSAAAGLLVDRPAPAARPAADPIGIHPLSSGNNALGVGLPFGHSDSETLLRLIAAARQAGAIGAPHLAGPRAAAGGLVARRDAPIRRRGQRSRLHRRSRRSAPKGCGLRRRADLRVGRDCRARDRARDRRRRAVAARWRDHPYFGLRQRLRPSGSRACGGVRPRRALRCVRRRRAVMLRHGRRVAGAARATRSSARRFAMSGHDYIRDGDAIYQRSFAIIRAETDLSRFSEDEADIVVRMVHACGSPEAANHIVFGHGLAAVGAGRPGRRRADPLRFRDGRPWHHARAAARGQRRDLHASRSARAGRSRRSSAPRAPPPRWSCGATGSRAHWSPSATRRPRCFICST